MTPRQPSTVAGEPAALSLNLCDPLDLLTDEQRRDLQDDLDRMAAARRAGWARAANLVIG